MRQINLACIIDDDPIFVFGTKRLMEIAGFCNGILIYKNGQEALNALSALIKEQKTLPEVILLDLNMPILDGWGFLDEITKIKIEQLLTIFIVSSSIDPADFKKAKEYNHVSNYVVKPVTLDSLKHMTEICLT